MAIGECLMYDTIIKNYNLFWYNTVEFNSRDQTFCRILPQNRYQVLGVYHVQICDECPEPLEYDDGDALDELNSMQNDDAELLKC